MKRILFLSLLFLLPYITFSQVVFSGYLVDEDNNKMKDVVINLYNGNDLVSTKKWGKKFSYDLKLESYYTIELIKKGFIPKRVAISTFEGDKGAEPFMFVMELLKRREGVDESELDFPSALIEYKKSKGSFNFNVPYSKSIKKEQKEALKKEN